MGLVNIHYSLVCLYYMKDLLQHYTTCKAWKKHFENRNASKCIETFEINEIADIGGNQPEPAWATRCRAFQVSTLTSIPQVKSLEFGGFGVQSKSAISGFSLFGPTTSKFHLDEHVGSEPLSILLVAPSGPVFPGISFWNWRIFFDQKVRQYITALFRF